EDRQRRDRRAVGLDDLLAGPALDGLRPRAGDVQELEPLPHLVEERPRHLEIKEPLDLLAELVQPLDAEGPRHPLLGPERVDEDRHRRALDVLEEERVVLALRAIHEPVGDLRDLELALDGRVDVPELPPVLQEPHELPQIREAHPITPKPRPPTPAPECSSGWKYGC